MFKHFIAAGALALVVCSCNPEKTQGGNVPAGENPDQIVGDQTDDRMTGPDPATVEVDVDSGDVTGPNAGINVTPADTTPDTTGGM
ncbi:hypothetical protein SAMN05421823_103486 [Catalinimonas alkaloidigena]|uniref:Uncharacterized protein n=1 Tax=Catalinimonas alkaloidigena TaxID=1075417 RepID=A0A1G9EID0_9BACT|nr:hypothetical protein [Catalinimonas alkaloidigena]SDK75937.1 hypothetical protein SAMN05421823_103486 [Catalinimonas alkaloidigena]